MSFADLLANNVFVRLVRGDRSRYELIASMVGAKLGDRVLVAGGGDGLLLASVGAPTGLTGRICAVETDAAMAERVRARATAEGALVEVEAAPGAAWPYEASSFDVVIVPRLQGLTPADTPVLTEAHRVLRPGGRCVVVTNAARRPPPSPADTMKDVGFRASRQIAERSKLAFYEATRATV